MGPVREDRCHGDRGMTLPELLVTIAIMGIIIPSLVLAIIVALRTTGQAADSFAESYDAELLVNYFVPDAQSANIVGTNDLDTPCDTLEQSNDIIRLMGLRFASGYRRVDLDPSDGVQEYVIERWSAPLEDTNGDGVPECGASGRTHVVAERIRNVTAFSDSARQVALEITATSGHRYSVSASARTGTIDLNHRPKISSLMVTCHNLECVGNASWTDVENGPDLDAVWDWGDGTPLTSTGQHEYASPGGTFTVTLTVTDDAGAQARASQEVTVQPNIDPVAANDAYETNEDSPLDVVAPGVLANDTDLDPIYATLDAGPAHGTLTFNPDGSFTYVPAQDYFGADAFTYHSTDVDGAVSAPATVSINVLPANDPPLAVPDAYTTAEDTLLDVAPEGVLANDSDVDDETLTAVLVTGPTHGTLTLDPDGAFRYTPVGDYNGPDSFTYRANDGEENSNAVTVSITVTVVNDGPPVAGDDSYSTTEDTPLTRSAPGLLGNDSDPDGDPMTAVNASDPVHGSVTLNANGSFTYIPDPNYFGPDSFTYQASDGSTPGAPATVNISVSAVNDRPVANSETYSVYEDEVLVVAPDGVLGNDTDVDSPSLTAQRVALPQHGSLVFNADGSFTYTPVANYFGLDSFTYFASDGSASSDTVTVTINVVPNPINDGPDANNDTYNVNEDTVLNVPAPGVLGNDTDVDLDPLTASGASAPAHGTVTLNPNGSFTYTPTANYFGQDSFTYVASDPSGASDTATVTINIASVNDLPTAGNDSYSTNEETALTVPAPGVLTNDSDDDGEALTAVLNSGVSAAQGTLTLNANGSFTYTPATNFAGVATFTYRARVASPLQNSNIATVTITVNAVNDPPTVDPDSYSTNRNVALTVPAPGVLTNDSDVDGDPLTAVLNTDLLAGQGTLTLNANGSFTYNPAPGFTGTATFTYRANDGITDSSGAALVTIQVRKAPTATFMLTCGQPTSNNGGNGRVCHADITSMDAEGSIEDWDWNWGDGTQSLNTVSASRTYTSDGVKTVTLTITDDIGQVATVQKQVYVNSQGLRVTSESASPSRTVGLDWDDGDFGGFGADNVVVYRCAGEVAGCNQNGTTISDGGSTTNSWATTEDTVTYRVCDTNPTTDCTNDVVVTYLQYEVRLDAYSSNASGTQRTVSLHWSGIDFDDPNDDLRLYRCTGSVTGCSSNSTQNITDDGSESFTWSTTSAVVTYRLCEESGGSPRCSPDLVVVFE